MRFREIRFRFMDESRFWKPQSVICWVWGSGTRGCCSQGEGGADRRRLQNEAQGAHLHMIIFLWGVCGGGKGDMEILVFFFFPVSIVLIIDFYKK